MRRIVCCSALAFAACASDGVPWQGAPLPAAPLHFTSADEGVYPDVSVLADPANVFARGALADATVWDLQRGSPVASFYAWATADARGATGERQYYAALDLEAIFQEKLADDADLPEVRARAIRGYAAVLTAFPTSVTYDATGTIAYPLATPAAQAIVRLGGTLPDGWLLITTPAGLTVAVKR